jgi:lactoylglutathione lyase
VAGIVVTGAVEEAEFHASRRSPARLESDATPQGASMKTLHTAYRVHDLARSADFYERVGFQEIGRVALEDGSILLMLNLPGDGEVVTLELVFDPRIDAIEIGNGFSHIAVQVADLDATLANLAAKGIDADGPHRPGGEAGPATAFILDPDGYRFEFVQWPPGHPDDMTRADFLR